MVCNLLRCYVFKYSRCIEPQEASGKDKEKLHHKARTMFIHSSPVTTEGSQGSSNLFIFWGKIPSVFIKKKIIQKNGQTRGRWEWENFLPEQRDWTEFLQEWVGVGFI